MQITAFPGEMLELGLEVLDENGCTTFSAITIRDENEEEYVFEPAVIIFNSLAHGSVNTKFYKRKGAPLTYNNLTVHLLLGQVCFRLCLCAICIFYKYTSELLSHTTK